jgi:hypothetical protein
MTEDGRQEQEWVATGTRVLSSDGRGQEFLTETGELKVYAERVSYVIGGIYTVQTSTKGGRTIRHGDPVYTGRRRPAEERALWEAEDQAAEVALDRAALERKHRKGGALDEALAPLLEIMAGTRTGTQRQALIGYVSDRLGAAYHEAMIDRLRSEAQEAGRDAARAIKAARKAGGK